MILKEIRALLSSRERDTLEFKEARNALPRSLFETVCAFLNSAGGTVLLGIENDGQIKGVDEEAVERLLADIVNQSNNAQKLDPPFILSPNTIVCEGKRIIVIHVPASPQVHRCAGVVYERAHDGDFRVQDPVRIAAIVNRKSGYHTEQVVYPALKIADFDPDTFKKARSWIRVHDPEHPWLRLSNQALLVKAGLWREDSAHRIEGYTLAAGLLFGWEETIQRLAPAYKVDGLVRRENMDRYDDRLNIRCNLVDAYDLLMGFVAKHVPDPFYLEGAQRISLREKIFREVVSNLLVHREYSNARPATLIIYRDRLETSNAAIPHGQGLIRPGHFTPFPKNPTLSKFFMQMGRGEELGSGVLNVHKYVPFYAKGAKPRFIEGDPFVTIIPLPQETSDVGMNGQEKTREKTGEKTGEKILNILKATPTMTTAELAVALGLTDKGVAWQLKRLQEKGWLRRVGPARGGHWEVILRADEEAKHE